MNKKGRSERNHSEDEMEVKYEEEADGSDIQI